VHHRREVRKSNGERRTKKGTKRRARFTRRQKPRLHALGKSSFHCGAVVACALRKLCQLWRWLCANCAKKCKFQFSPCTQLHRQRPRQLPAHFRIAAPTTTPPTMASGYGLNGGESHCTPDLQWLDIYDKNALMRLQADLPLPLRRPVALLPLLAGAALVLRDQQLRRR
jgi:hypothetical protein